MPGEVGPPGAKRAYRRGLVERLKRGDSYVLLLPLIVVDYFVLSLVVPSGWGALAGVGVSGAVLLLALHTSHAKPLVQRAAALCVAAGFLSALLGVMGLTEVNVGLVALLLALLLMVTPFVIAARIFRHEEITVETLAGAVDIYLLVGILFAVTYRFVSYLTGEPFFAQGAGPPGLGQYLYFSFVTLSTLGYGDLTPEGNFARSLVVFEAIAGQVYLVTAVARIVSLLAPRRRDS